MITMIYSTSLHLKGVQLLKKVAEYVTSLEDTGQRQKIGRPKIESNLETTQKIAKRLGLSIRSFQEYMRVANNLCPEALKLVYSGKVTDSITVLREIASTLDPKTQLTLIELIMEEPSVSVMEWKKSIPELINPWKK